MLDQLCDIGGAIRVARDDSHFPILNEEFCRTPETSKSWWKVMKRNDHSIRFVDNWMIIIILLFISFPSILPLLIIIPRGIFLWNLDSNHFGPENQILFRKLMYAGSFSNFSQSNQFKGMLPL